jgi:hypothetical protein
MSNTLTLTPATRRQYESDQGYDQDRRSKNENEELRYTLRVNGRVYAAYRLLTQAEDMANALSSQNSVDSWEIVTQ